MSRSYLSGIFGTSPVAPLESHISKVHECSQLLIPFIDACLEDDASRRDELLKNIVNLEREADELKKELRLRLPKSLFMPVDRRDLLEVLRMQDTIAGAVRDIAGLIVGRDIEFPKSLQPMYRDLVARSVDASAQAKKVINELDELVETGFGPKVVELVEKMLHELDRIEHDTDQILIELYRHLKDIEMSLNPIDVMFLYRLFDLTGKIGDRAQRVGSRLMLMLAK
jgi:predicted phosphate transport protein (TIGR00153 family)